jgi:hypothetical protein
MHPLRTQRGAATLGIMLALVLAVTIAALATQRRHAGELRAAAARLRAGQAVEAAEAGLEWATAMLNAPATGFRERHLYMEAVSGAIVPSARRAACVRVAEAWRCGDPASVRGDDAAATAFEVRFEAAAAAGTVHVVSLGCQRPPCAEDDGTGAATPDTTARREVTLALVPALAHPPMAALTVRGDVDAGTAALGLHNADPDAAGMVVHAGGAVRAVQARLSGPPGAPGGVVVERDAELGTSDPSRSFAARHGLDPPLWRRQPTVATVVCESRCNERLAQALRTHRLVFVDGDVALDGPLTLGSHERPVAIVAAGAVRLRGAIAMHGLVHGAGITWDDAGPGAFVRGAVVSDGGYAGTGAPELVRDTDVLQSLKAAGSFARLPGSWKDFR